MAQRYIVAYDLHQASSEDYEMVALAIFACGDAIEIQRSVWLVGSTMDRKQIFEKVRSVTNEAFDKIFVAEIGKTYRVNHTEEVKQFLESHPFET